MGRSLPPMQEKYLKKILTARVYDVAEKTPLQYATTLSMRTGHDMYLKREDMQPVFSFKLRGAYNKIASLTKEQLEKGVVTASAGNHAQGVALSGQRLGIQATIVMPNTTPPIKVDAVRRLGGNAVLHGDSYDEACSHALGLSEQLGLTFVHPFDDPEVIAGQGTVAQELYAQHSGELDAIFIPVGGGGLAAGMAVYSKYVRPEVKVIAVEPEDAACLKAALEQDARVVLPEVGLFADGVAVKQIGEETFELCRRYVDEVVTVSVDEICAAIKDVFSDTRSIAEPAGALAVAGMKKYAAEQQASKGRYAAVVSGANMNFDRLRHIAERTDIGEQTEALLAVTIPEQAGAFLTFCSDLKKRGITEFNYRYSDASSAVIFVGVKLGNSALGGKEQLLSELHAKGYMVEDLSDNEMAKVHIRYMVGGHAPAAGQEVLYRFQFPERPGALEIFLENIGSRWNISLFHYRNHGAAYGRVLIAMQVPMEERAILAEELAKLGKAYPYHDETDNPAFKLFL